MININRLLDEDLISEINFHKINKYINYSFEISGGSRFVPTINEESTFLNIFKKVITPVDELTVKNPNYESFVSNKELGFYLKRTIIMLLLKKEFPKRFGPIVQEPFEFLNRIYLTAQLYNLPNSDFKQNRSFSEKDRKVYNQWNYLNIQKVDILADLLIEELQL